MQSSRHVTTVRIFGSFASKTQKRPPEPGRRFCVPDQYDPAIAERLFLVDFGISVDSFVAQFFFDTKQLVVFGHTVGTAQ